MTALPLSSPEHVHDELPLEALNTKAVKKFLKFQGSFLVKTGDLLTLL